MLSTETKSAKSFLFTKITDKFAADKIFSKLVSLLLLLDFIILCALCVSVVKFINIYVF